MKRFIHLCIRYANYGMVISVLLIVGQLHAAELSHYNAKKIQYAGQLQQEPWRAGRLDLARPDGAPRQPAIVG